MSDPVTQQTEHVESETAIESQLFSVKKLASDAFVQFKLHFSTIFIIGLIAFIFSAFQILSDMETERQQYIIASIISSFVNVLAALAFITLIAKGKRRVFDLYHDAAHLFFPLIWISILSTLAVIAGMLFLIVPGIYIAILLSFTTYILVAEDKRSISALVQSVSYVKGSVWQIFTRSAIFSILLLVLMLIVFVTSVIIGIPANSHIMNLVQSLVTNLFVTPISLIFMYGLYQSVKNISQDKILPAKQETYRKWICSLIGIGLLITVAIIAAVIFMVINEVAVSDSASVIMSAFSTSDIVELISL